MSDTEHPTGIATLPMYTHARLNAATNRYWQLIHANLANAGIAAPATLTLSTERYSVWTDPRLVLSQTCGMPYRTRLRGRAKLVGTPDFGVEGCRPGYYCSVLVVRKDDQRESIAAFRDATLAYNGPDSQSGFAAPYAHTSAAGFWFENRVKSGVHLASAQFVATGHADIAALDAVTWRIIEAYEDCAASLRVLERTSETPGLPYITAIDNDPEPIFDAIAAAIEQLPAADRTALGLRGLVSIPESDYLAVPNPPDGML